jgi:hypothetical protein
MLFPSIKPTNSPDTSSSSDEDKNILTNVGAKEPEDVLSDRVESLENKVENKFKSLNTSLKGMQDKLISKIDLSSKTSLVATKTYIDKKFDMSSSSTDPTTNSTTKMFSELGETLDTLSKKLDNLSAISGDKSDVFDLNKSLPDQLERLSDNVEKLNKGLGILSKDLGKNEEKENPIMKFLGSVFGAGGSLLEALGSKGTIAKILTGASVAGIVGGGVAIRKFFTSTKWEEMKKEPLFADMLKKLDILIDKTIGAASDAAGKYLFDQKPTESLSQAAFRDFMAPNAPSSFVDKNGKTQTYTPEGGFFGRPEDEKNVFQKTVEGVTKKYTNQAFLSLGLRPLYNFNNPLNTGEMQSFLYENGSVMPQTIEDKSQLLKPQVGLTASAISLLYGALKPTKNDETTKTQIKKQISSLAIAPKSSVLTAKEQEAKRKKEEIDAVDFKKSSVPASVVTQDTNVYNQNNNKYYSEPPRTDIDGFRYYDFVRQNDIKWNLTY